MILTITPNPLLDYVIHCPQPPLPGAHRVKTLNTTVGGKGINVARMLKTLGKPALALGFCGGTSGEKVKAILADQGIIGRFVQTDAETRTGINLVIENPHSQTWWIEDGEDLKNDEVYAFFDLLKDYLPKARFLALSGTIPGNSHRDFYKRILEFCKGVNCETYLDAHGEPLIHAMEVGGFFLKHNRDESISSLGLDPFNENERRKWLAKLEQKKLTGAMVTDGPGKVLLWGDEGVSLLSPPEVREVSSIGSGDASLAGFIFARCEGKSVLEAARWAISAGSADATRPGPCEAEYKEVEKYLPRVRRL